MASILQDWRPPPTVDRKFWRILAISVALHASLFILIKAHRQHEPIELPPILASLRLIAPTESSEPATVEAAPPVATPPVKTRPKPPPVETRPTPTAKWVAAPVKLATDAPSSSHVASTSPAPIPSEPVTAAAPSPPTVSAAPASPPRLQADLLERYRQRLGELLARQQEYPRVAALRGWEGEVRLRLKVARKGNLVAVQLDRSSGFDVLDQHALAMLEGYGTLPALPDGLEANEIQVVVPVNYKLRKST